MTMTVITTRTDAEVQQDVLRELKWDPRVSATEVGVQVRNGIVTLTGTVNSYAKRLGAAEAAHRVKGVLDVANDLQVRAEGFGKKTDPEIAEAVRHALRWDVFVPDHRIRTTVSDGWVTLEGDVDRWSERSDAERAVERLAGVAGVRNTITVKASAADPRRLQGEIEDALERQAEREARRITVSVHDGVVTLAGAVRSWGERSSIERAVGYAPGVRRVDSNLEVDPYL